MNKLVATYDLGMNRMMLNSSIVLMTLNLSSQSDIVSFAAICATLIHFFDCTQTAV